MGTDIHGVIQLRDCEGKWNTIAEGYSERNYNAFAILADVRNGRGFAGIETGTGFNIIAEARGLPEDFEVTGEYGSSHPLPDSFAWQPNSSRAPYAEYPDENGTYWMGDHTWSWVSAHELLSFDWDQVTTRYGVVDEPTAKSWIQYAMKYNWRPKDWSGAIAGPGIQTISMEDYIAGKIPDCPRLRVRIHWEETYATAVGGEFLAFVLRMGRMGPTRYVFGFDS